MSRSPGPGPATIHDSFWRNSPSPNHEEEEEEGDGGQEWNYEVVGEEVDGERVRYEIDWDNWRRKDGTTQTWDNIHSSHVKQWKTLQARRRQSVLLDSIDIELDPFSGTDIHNTETRLRAQAFEEKLDARQRYSPKLEEQMTALLTEKLGPGWDPNSKDIPSSASQMPTTPARGLRLSTMRQHQTQPQSQRADSTRSMPTPASSNSSSWRSSSRPPLPAQQTSPNNYPQKRNLGGTSSGPSREDEVPRLPSISGRKGKSPKTSLRLQTSMQWTKIAQSNAAAPISFMNDVDDEELPPGISQFQYLEKGYIYADGIDQPSVAFQIGCDCKRCEFASKCDCQDISDVVNSKGQRTFAYNKAGLFRFDVPRGVEVIECNKVCRCGPNCRNRVAQRPRDVPLEIFKTEAKGWGVRASIDIVRGKVLGMYSGCLITRQVALEMDTLTGGYCFDLDGQEYLEGSGEDRLAEDGKFSVDSRTCGNWTRFVNHSCSPNMTIYLVVYDTIPATNRPYIFFVAREFIKAGTELTVDYDPASADPQSMENLTAGDSGGMKMCFCGSARCRNYVRMC